MSNDILIHHGVKGMKWGVRRYQNKDGSLTEQGRKHYLKRRYENPDNTLTDRGRRAYTKAFNSMASRGFVKTREDTDRPFPPSEDERMARRADETGVIPKGAKAYRTAFEDKLDSNRKYVSFTVEGKHDYRSMFLEGGLGGDFLDSKFLDKLHKKGYDTITYETLKELKVATTSQVDEYLASQQSNPQRYATILKDTRALESMKSKYMLDRPSSVTEELASEYTAKGHDFIYRMEKRSLFSTKYDEENPTFKHFRDLGYDAISDVEDGGLGDNLGWAPAVILNPKESLREVSREHHGW